MKYLVVWPRFKRDDEVDAQIMYGDQLRVYLDTCYVLPTGIYRLDPWKEPLRLYLLKSGGMWLLQDRFGNVENV